MAYLKLKEMDKFLLNCFTQDANKMDISNFLETTHNKEKEIISIKIKEL